VIFFAEQVPPTPTDHWQQLGVGGVLAAILIGLVLNFVLKFVAIKRESPTPVPAPIHATATNGKSGDRSTDFWINSISNMNQAALDRSVVPKLDDLAVALKEVTGELRAIREILVERPEVWRRILAEELKAFPERRATRR
jgi:hypothetical protein